MENIKYKFKKFLSLFLSIILIHSNIPVFAQFMDNMSKVISPEEIEELNKIIHTVHGKYARTLHNISLDRLLFNDSYIIKNSNPYWRESTFQNSFNVYYREIYELDEAVNLYHARMHEIYNKYLETLPEGSYLRKVTANYLNERMDNLFKTQRRYIDNVLDFSDLIKEQPEIVDMSKHLHPAYFRNESLRYKYLEEMYKRSSKVRNDLIANLMENQEAFKYAFSWDMENLVKTLERANSSFDPEVIKFFSKREHTTAELLNYFYQRSPEIQRSTLVSLRIADEGLTVEHLIAYMQEYLKKTNKRLLKVRKLTPETLRTILEKMPVAERTLFFEKLANFEPEAKALSSEFLKAEKAAGERILKKSAFKLSAPFYVIGSLLVIANIMQVQAQNNFSEYDEIGDMLAIKKKIDDGEILSFAEMSEYYLNPRNKSEILKNPFALTEVLEATIAVNAWLDDIEKYREDDSNIKTTKKVSDAFDKYYKNNSGILTKEIPFL